MRNLKKFLALVLAMAMAFSLMLSAGAVSFNDYPDKGSITAEFKEAVQVLTGLKVMQGDGGGFRPSDKITRAEAAAVIYRAVTGDVTDRQSALYKDYVTFTDVRSDAWYAGYVGYCQNAGYIKGLPNGTFNPTGNVTGYEVLAMILRAVGYGQKDEFVGREWQVNVASLSKQLGVTRNVVSAHMDQTLNMAAPREVVADLIFMTIATVPTVTYTPALAYNDKQSLLGNSADIFNPTLGQKVFGLFYSLTWELIDQWGRPGYYWWKGGEWNTANGSTNVGAAYSNLTTANTGKAYMTPVGHPIYNKVVNGVNYTASFYARYPVFGVNLWEFASVNTGEETAAAAWREENLVATITVDPSYATNEQVRECDVAHELGIAVEDTFNLFVNGLNGNDDTVPVGALDGVPDSPAVNADYRIVASDTVTKVGGQGRVTEFYYQISSPWFQRDRAALPTGSFGQTDNFAVMIDTMLARVNAKNDAKLDKNNHVIVPAQLEVTIWDGKDAGPSAIPSTSSPRIIQKPLNDATNWDDYKKGDYILINAWTNKTDRTTNAQRDSAAFETDKVISRDNVRPFTANMLTIDESVWIVDNGKKGIAESFNGRQTTIYYNQNKHQVDNKDYNDQLCLFMDRAGTNLNTTYAWYLDQFGNLIGIGDATVNRFGVITNVYAAISTNDSDTTGRVKAVASVRYTDGTTGTVTVDSFLMSSAADVTVASAGTGNSTLNAAANTQLTASKDTIELLPVYDEATHPAMSVGPITTAGILVGNSSDALWNAWLYMAPSAATNLNNHFGTIGNQYDVYGILYDHMFEFVTASDESVVAVEVAGEWLTNDSTNTGIYDDKANGTASNTPDVNGTGDGLGRVYKSLGYMALNTDGLVPTAAAAATAYLDNNTQILVRNGNRTLTAYTLETLPSNITLAADSDADWADVDGDGRIDYLYVTGSVTGTVSHNLFYYNGGTAQWDSTGGTIEGYLNGTSATITFASNGRAMFDAISNSANNYDGHLFAIRISNDVVSNVLIVNGQDTAPAVLPVTTNILKAYDGTAPSFENYSGQVIGDFSNNILTAVGGNGFGLGGSYTANTEAVYWRDSATQDGGTPATYRTNASYVRVSNGYQIEVTGHYPSAIYNDGTGVAVAAGTLVNETYWISPSAKIVGELEWLNQYECDLTIVYENTASNAATQVYITPDPDVTPVGNINRVVGTRPIGSLVVGGGDTVAALANSVTQGAANTVVWGNVLVDDPTAAPFDGSAGPLSANIANDAANPLADWMFFPFTAADGTTVSLDIKDSVNGTLVATFSRSNVGPLNPGDVRAFAVNFRGTAANIGTPNFVRLTVGSTYTFEITGTNGVGAPVVLSSGSFTMA